MKFSLPLMGIEQTEQEHDSELLVILMEECAEVQQRCAKILRYGASAQNINKLTSELGDLQCMINLAVQNHIVSAIEVQHALAEKQRKLSKWSNLKL